MSYSFLYLSWLFSYFFFFFFFNDTATTEIYTLSLHDALPICAGGVRTEAGRTLIITRESQQGRLPLPNVKEDRKSTRLNSSHSQISYAVFCLKKKKNEPVVLLGWTEPADFSESMYTVERYITS